MCGKWAARGLQLAIGLTSSFVAILFAVAPSNGDLGRSVLRSLREPWATPWVGWLLGGGGLVALAMVSRRGRLGRVGLAVGNGALLAWNTWWTFWVARGLWGLPLPWLWAVVPQVAALVAPQAVVLTALGRQWHVWCRPTGDWQAWWDARQPRPLEAARVAAIVQVLVGLAWLSIAFWLLVAYYQLAAQAPSSWLEAVVTRFFSGLIVAALAATGIAGFANACSAGLLLQQEAGYRRIGWWLNLGYATLASPFAALVASGFPHRAWTLTALLVAAACLLGPALATLVFWRRASGLLWLGAPRRTAEGES